MKQLKRVSKIKIQSNTRKEEKPLMKHQKKISKLRIQNSIKKEEKNTKMETEKAFEEVQGMSMVDPSILDTTAYRIIEDDWLKETIVGLDYRCDICLQ